MPISLVLWALIILAILTATAHASVNVSGTIKDPSGAVASNSFVRFQLMNTNNNQCTVGGNALGKSTVDFPADLTTGAIVGTLYRTDTEISCGGFYTARYNMTIYRNGVPSGPTKCIVVNGDFNIAGPVWCTSQTGAPALPAPQFVQTNPAGGQTIVQPPGSSLSITGALTMSDWTFLDARYALAGLSNVTSTPSATRLPISYISWPWVDPMVYPYNAVCNGVTDDHAALQSALNDAVAQHKVLLLKSVCATSVPLKSNPTLDTVNQPQNFGVIGVYGSPAFGTWNMTGGLKALSGIASGEPVLDFRLSGQVYVGNIGVNCNSLSGVNGIEFGRRDVITPVSGNSAVENSSIANCNDGVKAHNVSIVNLRHNNLSNNNIGFYGYYLGDSDLADNYINDTQVDHVLSSPVDFTGTGVVLQASGNINIHGGKNEWNAVGVLVYSSYGVNIYGINWDTNKTHNISLVDDGSSPGPPARHTTSVSIFGNRFLGGATNSDGSDPKAAISAFTNNAGAKVEASIIGNTFRKAGPGDAIDDGTTSPVGPVDAAVAVTEGAGAVNLDVNGNDFINGAGTNAVYAFGSAAVVNFGANMAGALTNTSTGGAVIGSFFPNYVNAPQLQSSVATGTAPLTVASTTVVPNLNAQLHNGKQLLTFTATLSPVAVTANTCLGQIFTITGVQVGDTIINSAPKPTHQAGLSLPNVYPSGANQVNQLFCNNTAASITPTASETYTYVVLR